MCNKIPDYVLMSERMCIPFSTPTGLHATIVRADANGGTGFRDGHLFGTKHE
jgi:hypothetical protein